MAETTKIAWTTSTFNGWIGCTEVSNEATGGGACDNCYARELDKRYKWGGATHWGPGVPRMRTGVHNWKRPLAWNAKQRKLTESGTKPPPWRVFCSSLADFADNEVPAEWHADLANLIARTPCLDWLLVTKRIGNVPKLYPHWIENGFPDNVRIIISVCNQREADRDVPKLLAVPCKNGVSYEPALGPVDWTHIREPLRGAVLFQSHGLVDPHINALTGFNDNGRHTALQWIIMGGESKHGKGDAREFQVRWAKHTIDQCLTAGVPIFVKQMGSNFVWRDAPDDDYSEPPHFGRIPLRDRAGAEMSEWPAEMQIRQFPT